MAARRRAKRAVAPRTAVVGGITGTMLTKRELRVIYEHIQRTAPPGVSEIAGVATKIARMFAETATAGVAGPRVFTIEIPLELAPTMNVYSGMQAWQRDRFRKRLDKLLSDAMLVQRNAKLTGEPRRRIVRITRHSSRRVDEITVDVIGGKMVLDRLVHAGIVAGDAARDIVREPRWQPCDPKMGKLTLEVFELILAT